MEVTQVKAVTKFSYKVFIDGQFAFVLNKGELSRYRVAEGEELSEAVYHRIRTEVVLKKAKVKALHLLNIVDRTEAELVNKLKLSNYTDDIIAEALAYVKSFGYINDEAYVRRYILRHQEQKSRKEIFAGLKSKGLDSESISNGMEEVYGDDTEQEAIRTLLRKKRFDPSAADDKELQKIMAYLARKGFSYDAVRQVIHVSEWNA